MDLVEIIQSLRSQAFRRASLFAGALVLWWLPISSLWLAFSSFFPLDFSSYVQHNPASFSK